MDIFQKYAWNVRNRQLLALLITNACVIGAWWVGGNIFDIDAALVLAMVILVAITLSIIFAFLSTNYIVRPMQQVWQAVMHIAPDAANVPAPKLKNKGLGAELIANLVSHIYQMARVVSDVEKLSGKQGHTPVGDFVANSLPLPLVVLDKDQTIVFANNTMATYIDRSVADIVGQNVYTVLDMSFPSPDTLDEWLKRAKASKAIDTASWERIRLNLPASKAKPQFDLAAYYNSNNPEGFETMLVFFDRTARYGRDDQALSFVALAVHELRTPVTLLRGYIEAFEEELSDKLDPELTDFMHKMNASAQRLSSFVNNILNVARIDSDQLELNLHEDSWPEIVQIAVNDMRLRASVQGIELVTEVADNLPTVGVERVTIYEVLNNLIDNAIKYSGQSKKILIKSYMGKDGMVETTVQDFGVGIPTSVIPSLFDKFYRSHRSRVQVRGTGLGLYLCKTIVEGHGGHIWVNSKEGQGSVFGFTVKTYAGLAEEQKNGNNTDIVRGAHGWIKNHSLYRG